MAGYTKNFNLKLPSDIEFYDIEDFNENFEKIDQMAVKKGEGIGELTGGALSDRPEPGIAGRYYFAQDTGEIFLDTGEEWVLAAASQKELAAHKADYIHHAGYGKAIGINDKTITLIPAPTEYKEGMGISFLNEIENTGEVTININELGAVPILKSNGNPISSGSLKAGSIYTIRYNGSNFILQGEGGEYGTAQPNHVLEGITFGTEDGLKVGTMPNRGTVNRTLSTQGGSYTIPEGYHNGSGKVTVNISNLIASNIRRGVNVGGVVGTFTGGAGGTPTYEHFTLAATDSKTITMSSTESALFIVGATYNLDWAGTSRYGSFVTNITRPGVTASGTSTSITITHENAGRYSYIALKV